jgi:hypothetical protein
MLVRIVVEHIAQRREAGDLVARSHVPQLNGRRDGRRGDDGGRQDRGDGLH